MLPGCLESVRGAVDEIVVVDTGSSDRTRELAGAAGALVLTRPWDDDFAAPRNLAARRARGDWLLVLDADERLAPGSAAPLRLAVARGGFEVGLVRLHNASRAGAPLVEVVAGLARAGAPELLPRLVRNQGEPEWRGLVHESLGEWVLRRGGRRAAVAVDLVHFGHLPSRREALGKAERNAALLRRSLAATPEDVTASGYLALELIGLGRSAEAAEIVGRAWSLLDRQPPHRCLHRLAVARGLLALRAEDGRRAVETALETAARSGVHPDLDYLRAAGLELEAQRAPPASSIRREGLAAAAAALGEAERRAKEGGPFDFIGLARPARLALHRGILQLQLGQPGQAAAAFGDALRLEPGNASAGVGLAEALLEEGQAGRALGALEPLLGPAPDGWLVAAAAAERLGAADDARLFLAEAERRLGAGLEVPHRRERLQDLRRRLGPAGEARQASPAAGRAR